MTAKKRPDLREPVKPADGGSVTEYRCTECNIVMFHKNWGRHCNKYHSADITKNDDDEDDDEDDDADQIGNGPKVGDANDDDDAVISQRAEEPKQKKRYEPKKRGPQVAAPKRRQGDSDGDQGTQIAKRAKRKVAGKIS